MCSRSRGLSGCISVSLMLGIISKSHDIRPKPLFFWDKLRKIRVGSFPAVVRGFTKKERRRKPPTRSFNFLLLTYIAVFRFFRRKLIYSNKSKAFFFIMQCSLFLLFLGAIPAPPLPPPCKFGFFFFFLKSFENNSLPF